MRRRRATSGRASASTPSTSTSRRASASWASPTWVRTRRSLAPRYRRRAARIPRRRHAGIRIGGEESGVIHDAASFAAGHGTEVVGIPGFQPGPLGGGTSTRAEILLIGKALRPALRRVLPGLLPSVDREVE